MVVCVLAPRPGLYIWPGGRTKHTQFNSLHQLSGLIVDVDELLDQEVVSEVDKSSLFTQAKSMLTPPPSDISEFSQRYIALVNPDLGRPAGDRTDQPHHVYDSAAKVIGVSSDFTLPVGCRRIDASSWKYVMPMPGAAASVSVIQRSDSLTSQSDLHRFLESLGTESRAWGRACGIQRTSDAPGAQAFR